LVLLFKHLIPTLRPPAAVAIGGGGGTMEVVGGRRRLRCQPTVMVLVR